jgi:hypothetical protein
MPHAAGTTTAIRQRFAAGDAMAPPDQPVARAFSIA